MSDVPVVKVCRGPWCTTDSPVKSKNRQREIEDYFSTREGIGRDFLLERGCVGACGGMNRVNVEYPDGTIERYGGKPGSHRNVRADFDGPPVEIRELPDDLEDIFSRGQ